MKEIWFIRHGESTSNAGLTTDAPDTIPLTAKGHQQALYLSETIERKPELIIVSPYLRTQQTAKPTIDRFSEAVVEVWPLHEFDYLSPEQCVGTNLAQRKPMVTDFWNRCEPAYVHGTGAESFFEFKNRIFDAFDRFEQTDANFIVAFVHGHIMRAVFQYIKTQNRIADESAMQYYKVLLTELVVNNTDIIKCRFEANKWEIVV
jgi:broad specificity phosphatase PhoE